MTGIRVLVVDDQAVVREGLRALLQLSDDVDVVGTAPDAEQMLELVPQLSPQVVLTDLRMPGMGGVRGIEEMRRAFPDVACVALTTYDDTEAVTGALRAGAAGFLNKDADLETIVDALRAAAEGRSLLDKNVLERLLALPHGAGGAAPAEPPAGLTERELEVVALITRGLSNQQIARELVVSLATVKTHINHVLSKTGCRDRAALVRFAYEHGITARQSGGR